MTLIDGNRCLRILRLCAGSCYLAVAGEPRLPEKPPGQFFPLQTKNHLKAPSFEAGRPVVETTYFYWYDIDTGSHIIDGDDLELVVRKVIVERKKETGEKKW